MINTYHNNCFVASLAECTVSLSPVGASNTHTRSYNTRLKQQIKILQKKDNFPI